MSTIPPIPSDDSVPNAPVEVLPPLSTGEYHATPAPHPLQALLTNKKSFYHPLSGILILGVDFVAFGSEITTGFLDLIPSCILAFIITGIGVFFIQRRVSDDRGWPAFGKAFLGAFLAGLPFSITGTVLGAGVIMLSGLPEPKDAWKLLVPKDR